MRLVAKKTTYTIAKGVNLADLIDAAKKNNKYPEPPEVDLVLEVTNTGDQDIQVWVKGDPVLLDLRLKGEGAMEGLPRVLLPREVELGEPITLKAGKTYEIPLSSLRCGVRGRTKNVYWTRPGEFTLTASLRTGFKIEGGQRGGRMGQYLNQTDDDFEGITLVSNAVKLKVEEK